MSFARQFIGRWMKRMEGRMKLRRYVGFGISHWMDGLPRWHQWWRTFYQCRPGLLPWVGRSPGRARQPAPVLLPGQSHGQRSLVRARQPAPVLLPGQSHGQRSLVGCSPQGHKESNTANATYCACHWMDGGVLYWDGDYLEKSAWKIKDPMFYIYFKY